jgi:hypothetical protein
VFVFDIASADLCVFLIAVKSFYYTVIAGIKRHFVVYDFRLRVYFWLISYLFCVVLFEQ